MPLNKREAERKVVEEFLQLYNDRFGTRYTIDEHGDAPDIRCSEEITGDTMELEITLLEELPGFIQSALTEKPRPISPITGTTAVSVSQESFPLVEAQVRKKLLCAYGPSTALVLKHVTPLWELSEWQWFNTERGEALFKGSTRSYGAGVWAVCTDNSRWPPISVIVRLDGQDLDTPAS